MWNCLIFDLSERETSQDSSCVSIQGPLPSKAAFEDHMLHSGGNRLTSKAPSNLTFYFQGGEGSTLSQDSLCAGDDYIFSKEETMADTTGAEDLNVMYRA